LPVVVFSPESGSFAAVYTTFNRDLASQGFVVVGVDHTYDSSPVEFPDGHLVLGILTDASNTISAEVRGQDVLWLATHLTLDNLAKWLPGLDQCSQSPSPRGVALGIYGHSIGGTTAALALKNAKTPCLGGASLDGPFYGSILINGFYRPWWYTAAEHSGNHQGLLAEWPKIVGWKEAVEVAGTKHDDYSDAPIIVPQAPGTGLAKAYMGLLGSVGLDRMARIVNADVRAFFEWSMLRQERSEILKHVDSRFPQVAFENI
jgi:Platelet-activating factor acetylhydrolase, isoform II